MKKHSFSVSFVSAMCILCAVVADNAFAAGSVRTFGGTGTYNGTAAAATATRSAGAAARAGSLRISPSTTRSISAGTRTKADGTTAPTERLSIGKYLSGATSISSAGGGSASGGASAAEITEINNNIQQLFNSVQTIEGDITNLENNKQDNLTAGDYIIIENDEVSLDITELEEYLAANLEMPNPIDIQYDADNDLLKWTKDGTTWTTLLNIGDLMGDYVTTTQLSETIATLATKSALDTLTERVTTAENAITELQTAIGDIDIPEQVQADWTEADNTKASFIKNKPTNLVTTNDLDGAIDGIVIPDQVQADWTESDDTKTSFIQHKPDLSDFVTTTAMNEALETKADAATIGEGFDAENTVTDAVNSVNTTLYGDPEAEEPSGLVSDVAELQNTVESLADVAFSGSYNDLEDKPDMSGYQVKPTSGVAEGKVLTYTGEDADTNVSASYILVPVATAAPSTVAPTGFVEMWLQ